MQNAPAQVAASKKSVSYYGDVINANKELKNAMKSLK